MNELLFQDWENTLEQPHLPQVKNENEDHQLP